MNEKNIRNFSIIALVKAVPYPSLRLKSQSSLTPLPFLSPKSL